MIFCARATCGLRRCDARAWGALFAPGARALRRASLDGRSRKLLATLL